MPNDTPQSAPLSDEELLLRYRDAGDASAFDELVHRYEQPLFRYLSRYLRSASLAEDVFQQTFVRLHEKRAMFQQGRRLRPWLYSIATHQAIDTLRKEKRFHSVSLNDQRATPHGESRTLMEILESREPESPDRCQQREQAIWAHHAIDLLPDKLRVVVLLIYMQGLTYREAAETLGIPLGTVKTYVHAALNQLKAAWWHEHPHDLCPPSGLGQRTCTLVRTAENG